MRPSLTPLPSKRAYRPGFGQPIGDAQVNPPTVTLRDHTSWLRFTAMGKVEVQTTATGATLTACGVAFAAARVLGFVRGAP